METVAGDYF